MAKSKEQIKRMVAAEKFIRITENSTPDDFLTAGHELRKVVIMEKAITPKAARAPLPKYYFKGLFRNPGELAFWRVRKLNTETIPSIMFRPQLSDFDNPFKELITQLDEGLRTNFGKVLPDSVLIIDELVTYHIETGSLCVWKRQAFRDYEDKSTYRLVLYEIDGIHSDSCSIEVKEEVAGGMKLHFCVMKRKESYGCEGLTEI